MNISRFTKKLFLGIVEMMARCNKSNRLPKSNWCSLCPDEVFLGKKPGLLSGNRGQIKKAGRSPRGIVWRKKDRAERPEQKTQTISEIYFYILQTHADHHPRDWKQFCRCSLGPRPCWRAVYLKGLIGSVVNHGDSSVWGWESERPSWITDYSKACADLTQPPCQSS